MPNMTEVLYIQGITNQHLICALVHKSIRVECARDLSLGGNEYMPKFPFRFEILAPLHIYGSYWVSSNPDFPWLRIPTKVVVRALS